MTTTRLQTVIAAILIASVAFGQDADNVGEMEERVTRTISATVRLVRSEEDNMHPDEQAMPELPFVLYVRADDSQLVYLSVALSDGNGTVRFDGVEVPDGYERVFFSAYLPRQSSQFDRETLHEYREHYNAMRRAYYWPHFCRGCVRPFITLRDEVFDYEMIVELSRSVVLTGGVERAEGKGLLLEGSIFARMADSFNSIDRAGRIPGLVVPADMPNEIFVNSFPVVASRPVAREETARDTNLGLISMPLIDRSVAFDGTLNGMLELREKRWRNAERLPGSPGITIISQDGQVILTWMTAAVGSHSGTNRLTEDWEVPLYAPPGVYYVAPGVFAADEVQLGLLDLLRAGVDLTDSGIPRIVLKEGEYGGMHEFDALEMDRAIREAMKKHLKPDEETEPAPKP